MIRTSYRVVDARSDKPISTEAIVQTFSPEAAAKSALGLDLVRSGRKLDLAARVYWQNAGQPLSLVRLYLRAEAKLPARNSNL